MLYINAATFLVSATLLAIAVPASIHMSSGGEGGYLAEVRAGLAFLWNEPLIRAVVLLVVFTNLLDYASFAVGLPVYADTVLDGAFDLGLLIAASGTGAIIGNLAYGAAESHLPRRATLIVAFLVIGARFVVLAIAPALVVILIALFVCRLAAGTLNSIMQSARLARLPPAMRGRVLGAMKAAVWALILLGPLAGGYLVDLLGVRTFLAVLAVLYTAAILTAVGRRALRDLDRTVDPEARSTDV